MAHTNVPASVCNVLVGTTSGTGASLSITTGFLARYVLVVNVAAGGLVKGEWFEGMAAASMVKTAAAGDITVPTTLGITVAAGTVTIGADTDLNVNGETLYYKIIG